MPREYPRSGPGAFAPRKRFAVGKTLAQGGFIPPEHKKFGIPAGWDIPWGVRHYGG